MKVLKTVLALIFLLSVCVVANAATNIYKDRYTTEDSTGNWTFAGKVTFNGNVNPVGNVTVIGNTPATLTTANSGETYIIDGCGSVRGYATKSTIVTVTLPNAAVGLSYRFVSGDGSGIVIRTSDNNINYTTGGTNPLYQDNDVLMWGLASTATGAPRVVATNTSIRLTKNCSGATGTSISVIGAVGRWYVSSVTYSTGTTLATEARAVNPNSGL